MHILLLIIQYPPDTNPTGNLMAQVVDGLRERGHMVDVITAFPHYAQFQIEAAYRGRLAQRTVEVGGDVLRLWVYASGTKQRMLHRLVSYLSFNLLAALFGIIQRRRYDVILAPNGSFFTGLAAAAIGAISGTPFVYNVQDLYPEVPVQAGQLTNRYAIAGMERLERLMYRLAAAVSVIAPSFERSLQAKGVPPAKVQLIPNFVDTAFIRPLPRSNALRDSLNYSDKFVVCYAGNLGYVYDLQSLLDAAALLVDHPHIQFLIVGEGVNKPDLERRARELKLPNLRFLPFLPRDQLPWLRAMADVQVALHLPGTTGYSLPSKIYEIMASGRPLLASADPGSDVATFIEQAGCGICLPPGQPHMLAQAILSLEADPGLRSSYGQRGRQYAEQYLARSIVTDQYEHLLARVAAIPTV
ncbi:MAG: glycosyltransferase family 4 protein [Oscillochloridaceae bacterium umkhey_bin13]